MTSPSALMRAAARRLDWVSLVVAGGRSRRGDRFRAVVRQPDGTPEDYLLNVDTDGSRLLVGEAGAPARLPICPQRHINRDGTFCLGWGPSSVSAPVNRDEATECWSRIAGFLDLQHVAVATGRWPEKHAWRHGAAAPVQCQLEQRLADLPEDIRARVHSYQRSRSLPGRLNGRTAECPCGSGRPLSVCHEAAVLDVLGLQEAVEREEEAFWGEWRDHPCCETMEGCPLRRERGRG